MLEPCKELINPIMHRAQKWDTCGELVLTTVEEQDETSYPIDLFFFFKIWLVIGCCSPLHLYFENE